MTHNQSSMDLYIYYKVPGADSAALQACVAVMQQRLARDYGIVTGLKRRPEEKDGRHTWMEIYEAVPEGFEAVLEREVTQSGLASLIDGPRHIEYFLDVSSCA